MGYIKEPEGVDFLINSRKLTKQEEEQISAFIKSDKALALIRHRPIVNINPNPHHARVIN
jgi:hypothetical protein